MSRLSPVARTARGAVVAGLALAGTVLALAAPGLAGGVRAGLVREQIVSCEQAAYLARPPSPVPGDRLLFDRVALTQPAQAADALARVPGPLQYWAKAGLLVRPARAPVDLIVPAGGVAADGWQNLPSYTRLRAPGCYAWQVDGTTFSLVIVFRGVSSS